MWLRISHLVMAGVMGVWMGQGYAQEVWQMQLGEMRVLALPEVLRVAVGDGHVLNAVTSEDNEVLIFARNVGTSTVTVWFKQGHYQSYHIHVQEALEQHQRTELKQLLERIPQLHVSEVGDKVVVEGNQLSAHHRAQLEELKKRYDNIVDLSHSLAWEPMVLLDVQVLEIPRNFLRELGVRWSEQTEGGLNTGLAWDAGSNKLLDRPGQVVMPLPYQSGALAGYFGVNALLSARLQALSQQGQAVVLAQPQLLARSGATAEFLAGGEVPYSSTDSNGNATTLFKPYGVSLKITPYLESHGAVRSHVDVEVSSIDPSLSIPTGPSLKTRRASTEFNVQSGQTLVLAGFISHESSENSHAVPGLGQMPILGALFKSKRYQRNETELAIFVTPIVVDAEHSTNKERVQLGQDIIASHAGVPRLNQPYAPSSANPEPSSWNPWLGSGSQWRGQEDSYAFTP